LLSDHQRKCTIVGDWPEKQKLEILSRKLWLTKRLTFVWVDDKDNWLHKFDIFVNPSYQEWLPTTVVEALLAKCIVVATDVWGTREITDGKDMLLSDPWNIEDLREKIEKSLHILQHAGHSESVVQRKFSADNAIQQYEKVIMKLTT
jgi:glycosyltransferase involved in cell wall biosynthesis